MDKEQVLGPVACGFQESQSKWREGTPNAARGNGNLDEQN